MSLKPATPNDRNLIKQATAYLRTARSLLREAGAPKAAEKAAAAVKSAEGAERHVQRRING